MSAVPKPGNGRVGRFELQRVLGRGAQDVLILRYLDLDADRLEADDVLFCHDPLPG